MMKLYLWTTASVFALILLAHLARLVQEGRGAAQPIFLLSTLIFAVLLAWAVTLLRSTRSR